MSKEQLLKYIELGLSQRQIAEKESKSQTTVKYWLKKYDLKTSHAKGKVRGEIDTCSKHGNLAKFRFYPSKQRMVCSQCESERVTRRRREIKRILLEEKGSCCSICGYNKTPRALHFHHVDPTTKERTIGNWGNSLAKARKEADKCILVCANCHAEIEDGII